MRFCDEQSNQLVLEWLLWNDTVYSVDLDINVGEIPDSTSG